MSYKYVIGYLRLSRDDEDREDESNSIKNQRLLIQQFVRKYGEFQESELLFFVDDGFSGTSFQRPDFKKMMAFVQKEKKCCIIVKDLSRFGRDTIDCQNYLEKVFPFLKIRFIAINDFYDSNDSISNRKDTEVKFKNLVNGIYPQICSQNIKQVMRKQAELGKYHGSVPPFGYQFPKDCKTSLLLDREAAIIVRFIFEQFMEGMRATEIARVCNEKKVITPTRYLQGKGYNRNLQVAPIWTYSMVMKIVTNPLYTGTMVNHRTETRLVSVKSAIHLPREEWICVQGTHAAIVSQKEFDRVMAIWRGRVDASRKKSGRKPVDKKPGLKKSVLRGKIRCGYCKRKMWIRCEARHVTVKIFCRSVSTASDLGCYNSGFSVSILEELVLTLIKKQAVLAEDAVKAVTLMNQTVDCSNLNEKKKILEEKEAYCKIEKMELYEKYVTGELTREEYLKQKTKLAQKEHEYRKKISELENLLAEANKREKSCQELKGIAQYAELEALSRPIVEELIETIYFYDPEHIEVIWKFQDEWLKFVEMEGKEEGI